MGQSILSKKTTRWQGLGVEPPTFRSEVQRANHYNTAPPQVLSVLYHKTNKREKRFMPVQQMAQLVTDYMENHGTRFLKQCVPVRVDKDDNGLLHVTWKETVTGETHQETFETVLIAIGKICERNCKECS